jgi:hypothetical protein
MNDRIDWWWVGGEGGGLYPNFSKNVYKEKITANPPPPTTIQKSMFSDSGTR